VFNRLRAGFLIAVLVVPAGCVGVDKNADCRWPVDHPHRPLDLSASADRRHLADDAQTAEDLAIRHADASRGPDWQRHRDEYRRVREACRATLNQIVATQHDVPVDAVTEAVADRRTWLDAAVVVAFASLFAGAMVTATSSMLRGALIESRTLATVMLLVASLGAGAVSVLAASVFVGLAESVRIGNGHVSYRVERVPLRHRQKETFSAGALCCFAVGAMQFRRKRVL
jgi:hypothetical protein